MEMTMETTMEMVPVVVSNSEFEKIRKELKVLHQKFVISAQGFAKEVAQLLVKLSTPQLQIIKHDFRGVWSADHIDRLVLYGQGKIMEHLASNRKCLPATTLRYLDKNIKYIK